MIMNTIQIPEILLPANEDIYTWAVNACDQFTSDAAYWREVEALVAEKRSTYHLIYPEIYLNDRPEERIKRINKNMREYVDGGVFKKHNGLVLVERTTPSGTRTGIVLAVDLEDYSFEKGAKSLIRSTEATILERIPPRVKIRENALIEQPHIMLLYDDPENAVLNGVERGQTLYDSPLMMGGGHVKGTQIMNGERVLKAFYSLVEEKNVVARYGVNEKLLFAAGDGNHSLATAKTCWERIKAGLTEEERAAHPARYALCEAVNIYDPALSFQPIHRLIKTDKPQEFLKGFCPQGEGCAYTVAGGERRRVPFSADTPQGIRELDGYIARFIAENGGEVDYIHGESELVSFSEMGVGILLPAIAKNDFFRLIISGGNLPRKTFSMGEGNEKRYYIEGRFIK